MIKIETHCHTGGSKCADCAPELIAKNYKAAGYGGAIITNHLQKAYFDTYPGDTVREKYRYFLRVYEEAELAFKKIGLKTFLAAEVLANEPQGHSEYIICGFDERFLFDRDPLFYYSQKELFELCDKNGVFMYKCHPFRTRELCGDPKYMHGAEAFNGHFHHFNFNALATDFCEKNGLIKMSGTDYHHDGQPITAGMFVPDDINDEKTLVSYIRNSDFERIEDVIGYEKGCKSYRESLCK